MIEFTAGDDVDALSGVRTAGRILAFRPRVGDRTWDDWSHLPAAERQRYRDLAAGERALERASTPPAPVSAAGVGARLGFTPEQLRHLCQPYCACRIGPDGFAPCVHWHDAGLGE